LVIIENIENNALNLEFFRLKVTYLFCKIETVSNNVTSIL